MIRKPTVGLCLVAVCGLVPAASPRAQPVAPPPHVRSLELLLLTPEKLTRVGLRVEVNGRAVSAIWDEAFERLAAYHDRNGDGALDEAEARRLPSPFALRQLLWGLSAPYSGPPVPWKELDRDGDGKVVSAELAAYYRSRGVGHLTVGVGRPRATDAMTTALLKAIDSNGDGRVTEGEWKAAADALRKFDRNDDELIGPGELVPRTSYPGALGAILLSHPGSGSKPAPELDGLPLIVLPADPTDTHWAAVIVSRQDRDGDGRLSTREAGLSADEFTALDADQDGRLSPDELAAWRKTPCPGWYAVRLGKRPEDRPAVEPSGKEAIPDRLRFDVRADEGKMPGMVATARKDFLDRFADADADTDGTVVEADLAKREQAVLKQLVPAADRNGDGKLSREELVAWLDLQDQVAAGHVLVTVLDHGAGLFELLDVDHDGALSVPELRRAWDRVKEVGCVTDAGKFEAAKLPRHLLLTVARGHPVHPLPSARHGGPAWFLAMDRNSDGYVSRREFTGTAETFDKFDLDRDGFISPQEAVPLKKK